MHRINNHQAEQSIGSAAIAVLISILILAFSHNVSAAMDSKEHDCAMQKQHISIHLNDVYIGVLINTVAELTGKNIIIDSRVDSQVTVNLDAKLDASQLHDAFLSILQVHQYKAIDIDDNTVMVVPEDAVILDSTIQNLRQSRSHIVNK